MGKKYIDKEFKIEAVRLASEPIRNTDGDKKQDCEINAGKRLVANLRKRHPRLAIIIVGDGLYSKQPFVDDLKTAGMSFILVAKLLALGGGDSLAFTDDNGRLHR